MFFHPQEGIERLKGILRHPGHPAATDLVSGGLGSVHGHTKSGDGTGDLVHAFRQHPEEGLDQETFA